MNVIGFNHLTLNVKRLEKSLPFYCDVLGMKLVHRGRTDVYLEWGNAWICLLEKPEETNSPQGLGMDHVAFSITEEAFFPAVDRLREQGVPLVREPIERGGGWSVQFTDPDGLVLELFTGDLHKRMENWK
ncbi:VOC family protein [Laceyella putida]|uniref:VOC family protein n=1 Tax=Laceyella putida TaxID=110101 RepID=A0ABW2RQC0_9BACL